MLSPRLLLPTSRLWLPGMSVNPLGQFGVTGGSCCGGEVCIPCVDTLGPVEFLVTLSAISGTSSCEAEACSVLNDPAGFVLTRIGAPENTCLWEHTITTEGCTGYWQIQLLIQSSRLDVYVNHIDANGLLVQFGNDVVGGVYCLTLDRDLTRMWGYTVRGCVGSSAACHILAL
jgi:hypothetical protein